MVILSTFTNVMLGTGWEGVKDWAPVVKFVVCKARLAIGKLYKGMFGLFKPAKLTGWPASGPEVKLSIPPTFLPITLGLAILLEEPPPEKASPNILMELFRA